MNNIRAHVYAFFSMLVIIIFFLTIVYTAIYAPYVGMVIWSIVAGSFILGLMYVILYNLFDSEWKDLL